MKFFLILILLAAVAHGAPANNDLYLFKELLNRIEHELAAPKHVTAPERIASHSPSINNPHAPSSGLITGSLLGNSLKIRHFDLLGEQLYGGYPFYADFTKDCIREKPAGTLYTLDTFFSSTKELFQHISSSTTISASLQTSYTMEATFSATTGYTNSETTNVTGVTLKIVNPNGGHYVDDECMYNLGVNENIERAFKKLPVQIDDPSDPSGDWIHYEKFLFDFGSHVITDVTYGSSVYQNTYSKSSSKYSQRMLAIRACLDMVGLNAGKLNVSVCSGVSQMDIKRVNSMETTKSLHARGGTAEQRAKIKAQHTLDEINQFLVDAADSKAGIDYKMEPIWRLLMYKFGDENDQDKARALNLEAYYKGFLSFGCEHEKDSKNKIVLQKFALIKDSPPTEPKYQCILKPEGCHDDDDCHYQDAFWCSCNGDTCIRYKTQHLASGQSKTTANINYDIWGWHGCNKHWKLGLSCYCRYTSSTWKVVWSLDNSPLVHEEVHEETAFKKKTEIEKIKMTTQAVIDENMNTNYY